MDRSGGNAVYDEIRLALAAVHDTLQELRDSL